MLGEWGPDGTRIVASEASWQKVRAWDRAAGKAGERRRVFPSMCDPFELRADLKAPRERFWDLIRRTPWLDWLILTKRPENWRRCWPLVPVPGHVRQNEGDGKDWEQLPNVWIGTSVEDQRRANERIPHLLQIPAAIRFLSVEPLLGPVNLKLPRDPRPEIFRRVGNGTLRVEWSTFAEVSQWEATRIHWVIVGGESGPGARPCHLAWARDVVRQCREAGTPCFVKQLGSNSQDWWFGDTPMTHDGTSKRRLKDSKGGDPAEWPEDLRVREMPAPAAATT